jgi:hypothetical protein
MSTPSPALRWNTPRLIEGYSRYHWRPESEGSDLWVVIRRDIGETPEYTVVGSVRPAQVGDERVYAAYDAEGVTLGTGSSRSCAALVAATDTARRFPAAFAAAIHERAYNYALGVLDATPAGVLQGVGDEADVARFAAAYRDAYQARPGDIPPVRTAFGEWRATGDIIPQDCPPERNRVATDDHTRPTPSMTQIDQAVGRTLRRGPDSGALRSTTLYLPVSTLIVDPAIAPDVDPHDPAVTTLVRAYDREKLGSLSVSDRIDGKLVVLDGYVRRQAMLLADPDGEIACVTYLDLTVDQERHLRDSINGDATRG